MTERISQPAISSASSVALRIASTVASMLTTTPLRSPLEVEEPMPTISVPCAVSSATIAPTL